MKIFGHPVHVMLIHFPSALLPMDLVCSLLASYTGRSSFVDAAFFAMAGGVLLGLAAIVTGAFDLIAVAEKKPLALRKALLHGGINITVILVYSVLAFRAYKDFPDLIADTDGILMLKGALVTLMMGGNYIGGSLILKHGVAIENK